MASAALKETPLLIVNLIMVMTVAFVLHQGLEVLGRTALIFLAIVLLIGVFSALVIVFSAIVEVHRLLPVLGNGVQPIIQSVVKKYALPVWGADCCYSSPSTSEPAEERDQGGVLGYFIQRNDAGANLCRYHFRPWREHCGAFGFSFADDGRKSQYFGVH